MFVGYEELFVAVVVDDDNKLAVDDVDMLDIQHGEEEIAFHTWNDDHSNFHTKM